MEVYDKLVKTVHDYLDREPVENTDEVISGKLLWDAVECYVDQINYIRYDNRDLIKYLNYIYEEEYFHDYYDSYKEATKGLGVRKPLFGPLKFKSVEAYFMEKKAGAVIDICPAGILNMSNYIFIHRDFNGVPEYYSDQMNDFLVRNCRTYFDNIFELLEIFSKLKTDGNKDVVDTGVFVIDVELWEAYSYTCGSKLTVKLSPQIDENDDQYKHFYGCDNSVHNSIMKVRDQILERIPVKLEVLSPFVKSMVEKYQRDLVEEKKKSQEKTYQKV